MDSLRISITVGQNAFEAEGPAEAVKSLYEDFRDGILAEWASEQVPAPGGGSGEGGGSGGGGGGGGGGGPSIRMTSSLRLFMARTGVTEEELGAVVFTGDGTVEFIREPAAQQMSTGQIEWALLLALRNAIESDRMEVDPEDVRSKCQDTGHYDSGNFASIFKRSTNAALFKGPMVPQGDPQGLTTEGSDELGRVVKRLAAQQA